MPIILLNSALLPKKATQMRTIRCKNPALLTLLLMLMLAGCSEKTPEQASVPQAPDQSAAATTASTPPAVLPEGRLPQQAVPQHYALANRWMISGCTATICTSRAQN
jgi:uncharacterized lipoprotein YajG